MSLGRLAEHFRSQKTQQGDALAQLTDAIIALNGGDIAPDAIGLEPIGEGTRRTTASDDLFAELRNPALPQLVARGGTEDQLLTRSVGDTLSAASNRGELLAALDTTTGPVYEYFAGKLPKRNALEKIRGKGSVHWNEQPTTIAGTEVRYEYDMEYSVHGNARSPKKVTVLLHSHYESPKPRAAETPKLEMTFVDQRLDSITLTFGEMPKVVFDLAGGDSALGVTLRYLAYLKRGFDPRQISSWPTSKFKSEFGTITLENLTSQPLIRIKRDDVKGQAEFVYNADLPGYELRVTNPEEFYTANPLLAQPPQPFILLTDQENVKQLLKDMVGLILSEVNRN